MSTPEENFAIVVDDDRRSEPRKQAIDALEAANECDKLSDLVGRADIEEQYREAALASLAHPECRETLANLIERGDLPESLQKRAETLLQETPDDAGSTPRSD